MVVCMGDVLNENGVQDPAGHRKVRSGAWEEPHVGSREGSLVSLRLQLLGRRCPVIYAVSLSESPAMSDTCFWVCLGLP